MADNAPRLSSKTLEEWLAEANRCEREGELFRAYDVAMQGLIEHPNSPALKHRAVLCLASTGATRQAVERFTALELDGAATTAPSRSLRMDVATLKARLVKDGALTRSGEERRSQLREAARMYGVVFAEETAAGNPDAYYPGINAASLFLLAGDRESAANLAGVVLQQLALLPSQRRGYYECVSEMEALLVLGRLDEARQRVDAARHMLAAPDAIGYRDLASTIRPAASLHSRRVKSLPRSRRESRVQELVLVTVPSPQALTSSSPRRYCGMAQAFMSYCRSIGRNLLTSRSVPQGTVG